LGSYLRRLSDCAVDFSGFEAGDDIGASRQTDSIQLCQRCGDDVSWLVRLFKEDGKFTFDFEIQSGTECVQNCTTKCTVSIIDPDSRDGKKSDPQHSCMQNTYILSDLDL
jgi:hypothetical protein